jgi:hypothetical protein
VDFAVNQIIRPLSKLARIKPVKAGDLLDFATTTWQLTAKSVSQGSKE